MSQQIRMILTSLIICFQWRDDGGDFKRARSGAFELFYRPLNRVIETIVGKFLLTKMVNFCGQFRRLFTMDASEYYLIIIFREKRLDLDAVDERTRQMILVILNIIEVHWQFITFSKKINFPLC